MFASMGKIAAMRIEDEAKMRSVKKDYDISSTLTKLDTQRLAERLERGKRPKVGQVRGIDLLLDLSGIPEELRYEKYFEARTILEDIMKKEVKENRP